jgi:hypothetical protein
MPTATLTAALCALAVASAAAQQPTRMHFRVDALDLAHHTARLAPLQGDSARTISTDSLSRSVRQGDQVRRCYRPVGGGRVVTWCIDHSTPRGPACSDLGIYSDHAGRTYWVEDERTGAVVVPGLRDLAAARAALRVRCPGREG